MEKISKEQHDEYATAFAILALYDGGAEMTTDQINALLEATGNEVEPFYPIIFSNFCTPKKLAELIALPSSGGGGGGGGGAAAAGGAAEEEKEEEKVEEEEAPAGGGDLFGDAGGGGDY
uniref:60S acidic ribosomal protein P1 n=1 Tax=Amphora coffeiformis TaxID=265554 RepID=A0A7S3P7L9_9STRA|mmetsp:Transcript_14449/g.27524  ORF Transcript_14449/g.27524 Transcript_14449/m.27524 type:complete len:119 (-) Transcript_14449:52-408(-)